MKKWRQWCKCHFRWLADHRKAVWFAEAIVELGLLVAVIAGHGWLVGDLDVPDSPIPKQLDVELTVGLLGSCVELTGLHVTVCVPQADVLKWGSAVAGNSNNLSFLERHTFDIPLGMLGLATAMYAPAAGLAMLRRKGRWVLHLVIAVLQAVLLGLTLAWFGVSEFKTGMCEFMTRCRFGPAMALTGVVLGATLARAVVFGWRAATNTSSHLPLSQMPMSSTKPSYVELRPHSPP